MPMKKKSHSFMPLILPGKCCLDLARVLDLEGLPEKGHMLGVLDDVIFMTVFQEDGMSVEEPVLYCFCCGTELAQTPGDRTSH